MSTRALNQYRTCLTVGLAVIYACSGYLEVDVDCNSSPSAGRIVSLVKSYARSLVVDLSFVVEAQTADELPERLLGSTRMMHIDLSETQVPTHMEGDV